MEAAPRFSRACARMARCVYKHFLIEGSCRGVGCLGRAVLHQGGGDPAFE